MAASHWPQIHGGFNPLSGPEPGETQCPSGRHLSRIEVSIRSPDRSPERQSIRIEHLPASIGFNPLSGPDARRDAAVESALRTRSRRDRGPASIRISGSGARRDPEARGWRASCWRFQSAPRSCPRGDCGPAKGHGRKVLWHAFREPSFRRAATFRCQRPP